MLHARISARDSDFSLSESIDFSSDSVLRCARRALDRWCASTSSADASPSFDKGESYGIRQIANQAFLLETTPKKSDSFFERVAKKQNAARSSGVHIL
jgi:hypothetical protein